MGITIHFKGRIDSPKLIESATHELSSLADELQWKKTLIDERKKDLRGIIICPHKSSEPLTILFDSDGQLHSIGDLTFERKGEPCYCSSTKTQYAPLDIHITIVNLLKHLKKKYISDLEVYDEGNYWNTGDEKVLEQKMSFLKLMIDKLGDALDGIEHTEDESDEQLADRIEAEARKIAPGNFQAKRVRRKKRK